VGKKKKSSSFSSVTATSHKGYGGGKKKSTPKSKPVSSPSVNATLGAKGQRKTEKQARKATPAVTVNAALGGSGQRKTEKAAKGVNKRIRENKKKERVEEKKTQRFLQDINQKNKAKGKLARQGQRVFNILHGYQDAPKQDKIASRLLGTTTDSPKNEAQREAFYKKYKDKKPSNVRRREIGAATLNVKELESKEKELREKAKKDKSFRTAHQQAESALLKNKAKLHHLTKRELSVSRKRIQAQGKKLANKAESKAQARQIRKNTRKLVKQVRDKEKKYDPDTTADLLALGKQKGHKAGARIRRAQEDIGSYRVTKFGIEDEGDLKPDVLGINLPNLEQQVIRIQDLPTQGEAKDYALQRLPGAKLIHRKGQTFVKLPGTKSRVALGETEAARTPFSAGAAAEAALVAAPIPLGKGKVFGKLLKGARAAKSPLVRGAVAAGRKIPESKFARKVASKQAARNTIRVGNETIRIPGRIPGIRKSTLARNKEILATQAQRAVNAGRISTSAAQASRKARVVTPRNGKPVEFVPAHTRKYGDGRLIEANVQALDNVVAEIIKSPAVIGGRILRSPKGGYQAIKNQFGSKVANAVFGAGVGTGGGLVAADVLKNDKQVTTAIVRDAHDLIVGAVPSLWEAGDAGLALIGDGLGIDEDGANKIEALGEAMWQESIIGKAARATFGGAEDWDDVLTSFKERPVTGVLELAGLEYVLGRGAGLTMRSGALGSRVAASAQLQRGIPLGPDMAAVALSRYSPDVFRMMTQKLRDRSLGQPIDLDLGVGRGTPIDRMRRARNQRIDSMFHVKRSEVTRRQNEVTDEVGKKMYRHAQRAGNNGHVVMTLSSANIIGNKRTARGDVGRYRAMLEANGSHLDPEKNPVAWAANRQAIMVMRDLENNPDVLMRDEPYEAAAQFKELSDAQQEQLFGVTSLERAQMEKAAWIPYAIAHMGARHDKKGLYINEEVEVELTPEEKTARNLEGRVFGENDPVEFVPIDEVKRIIDIDRTPGSRTAKRSAKQMEEFVEDIQANGITDPLIGHWDRGSEIIFLGEGHNRLLAAEAAGMTHIPIRFVRTFDASLARADKSYKMPKNRPERDKADEALKGIKEKLDRLDTALRPIYDQLNDPDTTPGDGTYERLVRERDALQDEVTRVHGEESDIYDTYKRELEQRLDEEGKNYSIDERRHVRDYQTGSYIYIQKIFRGNENQLRAEWGEETYRQTRKQALELNELIHEKGESHRGYTVYRKQGVSHLPEDLQQAITTGNEVSLGKHEGILSTSTEKRLANNIGNGTSWGDVTVLMEIKVLDDTPGLDVDEVNQTIIGSEHEIIFPHETELFLTGKYRVDEETGERIYEGYIHSTGALREKASQFPGKRGDHPPADIKPSQLGLTTKKVSSKADTVKKRKYIDTDDISAHAHNRGISDIPAFYSMMNFDDAQPHVVQRDASVQGSALRFERRSGDAVRYGTFDLGVDSLLSHSLRAERTIQEGKFIEEFTALFGHRDGEKLAKPMIYSDAKATAAQLSQRYGEEFIIFNAETYKRGAAARHGIGEDTENVELQFKDKRITGDLEPALDRAIVDSPEKAPKGKAGKRREYVVVPRSTVDRTLGHLKVDRGFYEAGAKDVMRRATKEFKGAVLPFNPRWLAGNTLDMFTRVMFESFNPIGWAVNIAEGHMLAKKLKDIDEDSYHRLMHQLGSGYLTDSYTRLNEEHNLGATNEELAIRLEDLEKMHDPQGYHAMMTENYLTTRMISEGALSRLKQLYRYAQDYSPFGFKINHTIERMIRKGELSREMKRQLKSVEEGMFKSMLLGRGAMHEAALRLSIDHDRHGAANMQDLLARQVNKTLGDYASMSPTLRAATMSFTPFALWARASLTWVLTLPAKHPAKVALLAALNRTTEGERAMLGLSMLNPISPDNPDPDIPFERRTKPPFLQGLVDGVPTVTLSSFGTLYGAKNLLGVGMDFVFPEFQSAYAPVLYGVSWTGEELVWPDGRKVTEGQRTLLGVNALVETFLPPVRWAKEIMTEGSPAPTSTILDPRPDIPNQAVFHEGSLAETEIPEEFRGRPLRDYNISHFGTVSERGPEKMVRIPGTSIEFPQSLVNPAAQSDYEAEVLEGFTLPYGDVARGKAAGAAKLRKKEQRGKAIGGGKNALAPLPLSKLKP
jgi:hypothetical protein